jgi:hypothetical protein
MFELWYESPNCTRPIDRQLRIKHLLGLLLSIPIQLNLYILLPRCETSRSNTVHRHIQLKNMKLFVVLDWDGSMEGTISAIEKSVLACRDRFLQLNGHIRVMRLGTNLRSLKQNRRNCSLKPIHPSGPVYLKGLVTNTAHNSIKNVGNVVSEYCLEEIVRRRTCLLHYHAH